MFLDFHRTSVGRFLVMAEVTGSMGERATIQVGRFHKTPAAAVRAAINAANKHNYRYCYVTNNTGWTHPITDADNARVVRLAALVIA